MSAENHPAPAENSDTARPLGFPATVVKVIDEYTVVINRGARDGVRLAQAFLIFGVDEEELTDPETGESLGRLEVVRGKGRVSHVQDRLATVKSVERRSAKVVRRRPQAQGLLGAMYGGEIVETSDEGELMGYEAASVGDRARPI